MVKRFLKKSLAFVLVMAFQFVNISAYAANTDTFNPLYSGVLKADDNMYMTVSKSDAVMTKVIYPITSTSNRFLTISGVDDFTFDAAKFIATYNHKGIFTDYEGNFINDSPNNVVVQTTEVHPQYILGFILSGVYIDYNGCRYTST